MPIDNHGSDIVDVVSRLASPAVAICITIGGAIAAWVRTIANKVSQDRIDIAVLQTQHDECKRERERTTAKLDKIFEKLEELAEGVNRLLGSRNGK